MDASKTTLSSPALDHIIERPRLIALLEEGDARIILLAAPAGYGKTTLARQWSARQTGPVAWHRTTRSSGDVAALAVALDELLNKAVPQPGRDPKRIAAIAAVNARPLPLARALVSTYASLTPDLLLILDEWEAAGTEEADELVAHLVDELDIRFLVTSRTRPPWFTSRLTVYGEGVEIGMEALSMTDQEALAVLALDSSAENAKPLLATARGWPAVVGLAATRAAEDLPARVAARTLYDYLATELLDSAPAQMRRGLLLLAATAITDVGVAQVVLGEETRAVIDNARRRSLVRVEDDSSLSLHPLLRELLVARLHALDGQEISKVVASLRPLITTAHWDEALAAAEALPEASFVTEALGSALPDLLRTGRTATLRRWVAAGRAARAEGGLVDYADAEVALREADFNRAITLGELAARVLKGDLASNAYLVAAQAANLADRLDRARRNFAAAEEFAESPDTRAAAIWGTFVQAVDDEASDVSQRLAEFQGVSGDDPEKMIRAAHGQMRLGLLEGCIERRLDDAEVLSPLLFSEADPMIRASFLNTQSTALSIAGRYEAALAAAEHEREIADEFELELVLRHALINRARALIGLRQIAASERTLAELRRRLVSHEDLFLSANSSIERARLYVTLGDLRRAHSSLFLAAHPRLNNGTRGEYLALRALVLAALGKTRASEVSSRDAVLASRLFAVRALVSVARAITRLHVARTDDDAVRAFSCACADGALDAIVMGCRASTEFAARIASSEEHRDSLTELLIHSKDSSLGRHLGLVVPRSINRSTKLSPREVEIYELIAQGMTNDEISGLLFISPSTTKVHVRHIFEKLGVHSRVEAVRLWQTPDN